MALIDSATRLSQNVRHANGSEFHATSCPLRNGKSGPRYAKIKEPRVRRDQEDGLEVTGGLCLPLPHNRPHLRNELCRERSHMRRANNLRQVLTSMTSYFYITTPPPPHPPLATVTFGENQYQSSDSITPASCMQHYQSRHIISRGSISTMPPSI